MLKIRIKALAQQLQHPPTEPELRQVLHALLVLFQDQHDAYLGLVDNYERCTVTLRTLTQTCEHLTQTCTRLTAERQALAQALLRTYASVAVDPGAWHAIDPRHPDSALRLCHVCQTTLE